MQWDEGPDLSLFSEGRACYRAPLAYLVESFSIHADDDGHPGRKSRFLLNVVGRDYGFYPVHTFRRVVIGGQWSDAWFTYTLAVSVMIAPCGFPGAAGEHGPGAQPPRNVRGDRRKAGAALMKYSVFLSQLVYVEVELEAEDPTDAAQRVVLAAATEMDFLQRHPDYMIDELEAEVVTVADKTAVNADSITMADYNSKVVLFDA